MRYAVRVKPTFDFDVVLSFAKRFGTVYAVVPEIFLIGIETDPTDMAYLSEHIGVQGFSEDVESSCSYEPPNDPAWSSMWFASALSLLDAWGVSTGEGVSIAVLDTGIDPSHVDFQGRLLPGWCVVTDTANTAAVTTHGASTMGVAVANANNSAGAVGIAHGSYGIPIRVSTAADGKSSDVYFAAGVVKAVELGARVINVSFSNLTYSHSFLAAAEYARRKGAVVVGAMDNSDIEILAPASSGKDVIFVSGINSSFDRVYSRGEVLWVRAPQGIPAPSGTDSSYYTFSGNSAAAPVVAGVCALILSIRPDLGVADVRQILAQTADKKRISGSNGSYTTTDGHGLINAGAAVKLAQIWRPVGAESPRVAIVSPKAYESFAEEEAFQIEIATTDDVQVSKVELYIDGVLEQTLFEPPFVFNAYGSAGSRKLKAIAYDNLGQNSDSAEMWVRGFQSQMMTTVADFEYMLPPLTGNCEYEIRATYVNLGGLGPWSEWVPYVPADEPVKSFGAHFVEQTGDMPVIHYTHPHAGQRLECRFAGGAWSEVTQSPFTLSGLSGAGDLEFRVSNLTESSDPVLIGQFNLNRIYYVIYESHLAQPTAEQILAGQNALGQSASASGSEEASTATTLQQFLNAAVGLTPDTNYRIAFVGTDGVGFSNVVVSDTWKTLTTDTMLRAVVLSNGTIYELPNGQEGTGKKPLVLHEGTLRERLWVEGTPVVLDAGSLRTLTPDETLVI